MRGGSKADDQNARVPITEAGERLAPILLVQEGFAPRLANLLAVGDKARAVAAIDDFVV